MNQMDVCPEAAFVQKIKNTAADKTAFIDSYTFTVSTVKYALMLTLIMPAEPSLSSAVRQLLHFYHL